MSAAFVRFDDVSLAYDGTGNAIEDINLSIREGEFVAFVGPSGCGKSTFMKLCTGLHAPTQGSVSVDGAPVTGPLKISGMAFQNANLLPWRTTLDNVLLPLEIVEPYRRQFRKRREEFVGWARSLLKTVGLAEHENKYPWQLSGGMQQRASICRALIHQPRLLMLDEPFGALDAFTREDLWQTMHALRAKEPFTAVLITHDLRESVYLGDQVIVLSGRPATTQYVLDVKYPGEGGERKLEGLYTPACSDMLAALREQIQIAQGRQPEPAVQS